MRIAILIVAVCLLFTSMSCIKFNKERAVEYYEQHVRHFPEEG